ncbi:hypothetical protein [Microbacterium sp.]|uniref:hypothetical protein n=1 Tax=Microbacterium sp. TaxID=51671 RepID=UPI003A90CAE3
MTDTPPSTAKEETAEERTVLTRVRRMTSLIPTPWLITAGGAILLAATAGFGGLATAPVPPTPKVAVGEQYSAGDLTITVHDLELRTERGNALVFPKKDEGEKVLAITVEATNTFHSPRSAESLGEQSPVVDGIRVEGVEGKPTISRTDGGGDSMLQPDVPAQLVLAWIVEPDQLHDGQQLHLTLPHATHFVGTNVLKDQDYWSDITVGATLTAPLVEIPASDDGSGQ